MTGFAPCGRAPIGLVTNCTAMDCAGRGCAMDAPQVPVSLDDLVMSADLDWGFCPHCGDRCVLEVHGVAACGENRR